MIRALGLMSGSSLDGCDMALIEFDESQEMDNYQIIKAETVGYDENWVRRLQSLPNGTAIELGQAAYDYSVLIAGFVRDFLGSDQVDFIGFHGHTIFHFPDNGFTTQIGNGGVLSALTGFKVVCDFRSTDIALGGQGTPLAAIVDKYLFHDAYININLGGICNMTIIGEDKIMAWDICPCNQLLNHLAQKIGLEYDPNGIHAREGGFDQQTYQVLMDFSYYKKDFPKSLDNSSIRNEVLSKMDNLSASFADQLHTSTVFIADQISNAIEMAKNDIGSSLLSKGINIAGGGAHNSFLIEKIKEKIAGAVIKPMGEEVINFKESILIAFCAYLRIRGLNNVLSQVTGAERDSIGGAIYESQ